MVWAADLVSSLVMVMSMHVVFEILIKISLFF